MNAFLCRCSMFDEQQVSSSHSHISPRLRSDLSAGHRIAVRRLWTTRLKTRSVYKSYKWILPALVSVRTRVSFRSTSLPSERSRVQIPQRLFITVTPSARWSVNAPTGPERFCRRPDFIKCDWWFFIRKCCRGSALTARYFKSTTQSPEMSPSVVFSYITAASPSLQLRHKTGFTGSSLSLPFRNIVLNYL